MYRITQAQGLTLVSAYQHGLTVGHIARSYAWIPGAKHIDKRQWVMRYLRRNRCPIRPHAESCLIAWRDVKRTPRGRGQAFNDFD